MEIENIIPIIISSAALILSLFKYLDKSKEKINKAFTDIELLKLKIEQVCRWGDHVEQNLLDKISEHKEHSDKNLEKLSDKLDEIKDELND